MKLKLAIAACIAAVALPASPAVAATGGIPGTCFETKVGGGGGTTTYQCECLVGVPWVDVQSVNPLIFTVTYCIVNI